MKPFQVEELKKKLIVRFSNKTVVLPVEIQTKIDTYWQELLDSSKNYRRGEVFTVTRVTETEESIEVLVEKSDYAHYLYCQNVDTLGEYGVRIIHTSCLVLTNDNKVIFGEMGKQTARNGILQLCGGGIDLHTLEGDVFNLTANISHELEEELGIDVSDSSRVLSFGEEYLKSGGPTDKMTVIYELRIRQTEVEFLESYKKFEEELQKKGEEPEFGRILSLPLDDKESVENFFAQNGEKCDEYMKPVFEFIIS